MTKDCHFPLTLCVSEAKIVELFCLSTVLRPDLLSQLAEGFTLVHSLA